MNCPICHHEQDIVQPLVSVYATKHPLFVSCRLVSCVSCKSSWVSNPPDVQSLKKYYDVGVYGDNTFLRFLKKPDMTLERCQALARWNFVRNALKNLSHDFTQTTFSVCDIGAGFGCTYEVGQHQNLSINYFAFESSSIMRKRILSLGGEARGDFFQYEPSKQFDLVWASHILEHYPDPDDLLKKMQCMIKPRGAGLIEIPCLDYEFKEELAPHLLFFTVIGLKMALERNGFKVLRADTVGCLRRQAVLRFQTRAQRPSLGKKLKKVLMKEKNIKEDLDNRSIFERWNLEVYGGERSWIRAVFTPKSPYIESPK